MPSVFSFNDNEYSSQSLDEWISSHHSEEELRNVFLNMDKALKYIHDHGYCIQVFFPTEIYVLNNEVDHIQFKKLLQLPDDISLQKQMIQEDIFNSSFIQIGLYSNSLKYLKPDFLKENYDSFTQFIPSGDVPYYRGVVQRGASVYFCEYDLEKRKRDLQELEKQLGDDEKDSGKMLLKNNNNMSITNDRVNDTIYRQINGLKDTAFVNSLIIPAIIIFIIFIFGIIAWIISIL